MDGVGRVGKVVRVGVWYSSKYVSIVKRDSNYNNVQVLCKQHATKQNNKH